MRPLVIAHRGASGYLPEGTLPAKALAVGMGADYVEHDVVMTRDDRLLINHDLWLDNVSDVARRFPGRERADGHFYVIDFDLDEILSLAVTERFNVVDGRDLPAFPDRFPVWQSSFHFHTLESELEFLQGLRHSSGRDVGVFTELKSPWFHEQEGKDLVSAVYAVLARYGYRTREDRCRVMSFDAHALQRIRAEVGPAAGVDVPLTQLIGRTQSHETYERKPDGTWENYDYDWMLEPDAMERTELLDRVMNNYRRFYLRKALFKYPWIRDKVKRRYMLGCLKAFAKSGFQRTFYDLGRVGYWGPQSKKSVDFHFDAKRTLDMPAVAAKVDEDGWVTMHQGKIEHRAKQAARAAGSAPVMACGGGSEQLAENDPRARV